MLIAHLAARLLEQQRAAAEAEFARQLPLYAEAPTAYYTDPEDTAGAARTEPDWATNY
jgi:hypothetical protein